MWKFWNICYGSCSSLSFQFGFYFYFFWQQWCCLWLRWQNKLFFQPLRELPYPVVNFICKNLFLILEWCSPINISDEDTSFQNSATPQNGCIITTSSLVSCLYLTYLWKPKELRRTTFSFCFVPTGFYDVINHGWSHNFFTFKWTVCKLFGSLGTATVSLMFWCSPRWKFGGGDKAICLSIIPNVSGCLHFKLHIFQYCFHITWSDYAFCLAGLNGHVFSCCHSPGVLSRKQPPLETLSFVFVP